jgi:hypothetical protein
MKIELLLENAMISPIGKTKDHLNERATVPATGTG